MTAGPRERINRLAAQRQGQGGRANGQAAARPATVPTPEYKPFPLHTLPDRVQAFAETIAVATNADLSYAALPILSVLGAGVGATRAVEPKQGWKVFPSVWAITIGRSATGKTPPQVAVDGAVQLIEDGIDEENDEAAEEYERKLDDYQRRRKAREAAASRPPEPRLARFRVGDVTIESLAGILEDNPRGVWLWMNEAAGWVGSFTRYRTGGGADSDRPRWLSLFDSGSFTADRKTGKKLTVKIRNALVCVCGGIQPKVLKSLMTEDNVGSGLFARMLLAYPPERLMRWNENGVPDDIVAEFAKLLGELRGFGFGRTSKGKPTPALNYLSRDAKDLFIPYYNRNREIAFTSDDGVASSVIKLESYAIRFAHLRHLCRFSTGNDGEPISAADMAAGIELANWFANELHRIQVALQESEHQRTGRNLVEFIRRRGGTISVRELQNHDTRKYRTKEHAEAALQILVDDRLGDWVNSRAGNGQTVTRFVVADGAASDTSPTPLDSDG